MKCQKLLPSTRKIKSVVHRFCDAFNGTIVCHNQRSICKMTNQKNVSQFFFLLVYQRCLRGRRRVLAARSDTTFFIKITKGFFAKILIQQQQQQEFNSEAVNSELMMIVFSKTKNPIIYGRERRNKANGKVFLEELAHNISLIFLPSTTIVTTGK